MRCSLFLPLVGLVACAHVQPPSVTAQTRAARDRGDHQATYELGARALCEAPNLAPARWFVEAWHALGAAGEPTHRLADCILPPFVEAYLRGLIAGARGDKEAGEAGLAAAEAGAELPDRGEIAYRRGLLALGSVPELALQHLERASGLEPGRADIRLALAQALLDLERFGEAQAMLGSSLALAPTAAELERARQLSRHLVRRAEPALPANVEQTLTDLLAQLGTGNPNPETLAKAQGLAAELDHPRVLKIAGLAALHRGLDVEARHRLEEAAALNPLDPEPWRIRGAALMTLEQPREALTLLREAHRRDPFDPELARLLASAATAVEAWETARDAYAGLSVLEPKVAEHHLWLARTERRLGHLPQARLAVERGCALQPAHIPLLVELASIEAESARRATDRAERSAARARTRAAVERLLTTSPEHPAAAAILASLDE